jgi:hypothetical protein
VSKRIFAGLACKLTIFFHAPSSYLVLLGGFYMAPPGMDTSDDPLLFSTSILDSSKGLFDTVSLVLSIVWNTLFSR